MNGIDWIIIRKSFDGTINDREKRMLSEWLADSEEHRILYRRMRSGKPYALPDEQYEAWKSEYTTLVSRLKERRHRNTLRRLILRSVSVAALLLLAVSLAWFLERAVPDDSALPGESSKVRLQLADGHWVDLETTPDTAMPALAHAKISAGDKTLAYRQGDGHRQPEYNRLHTERGGEWNVLLEDGTKVYLNAASTLEYPVAFSGDKREVVLEGEAYFDVAPNPERSFVVRTGELEIVVRGTSFNLNAYPEQHIVRTTLVSGKIEVAYSGRIYTVLPDQQFVLEKETKSVRIEEVDPELYTSWRNGFYKFNETRLEDILTPLALWYDVEVVYADDAAKELRFTTSGKIPRYGDLRSLLKKFEYTDNVTFEFPGKQLIVRQK